MPSVSCFVPASITALHASLSSELLSLRQIVISYAFWMNALQSLSTSDVHAKRCSGVPCEKERAGEAVVDSKASDTHKSYRQMLVTEGVRRQRIELAI